MAEDTKQKGGEGLNDEEQRDLRIGVMLAQDMIDKNGAEVIKQALSQSNDPGQVIGQFLMQLVSQLGEMLPEELQLSKKIYFARNGWVEQISDYLQEEYSVPRDVMDRAEIYIGTTAQEMAATKSNPQAAQAAQQQQAAPQQEVPPTMPQGVA